ncbi:hypothetical protein DPMN_042720 [Dreissena polymorpha]|uniref:Uncharacterized protein n=1 Tax=Dreissena polymorpha TaxID=45954 RepID=A0A9D4D2J5_DREPO|nr:hypothetical protein DPMN_042720 [Dreissena polymorpha]
MRHADICNDHSLLVAKLTLKLRKAKTEDINNQRYDVEGFNRVMKETGEEVLGFRKSKKT